MSSSEPQSDGTSLETSAAPRSRFAAFLGLLARHPIGLLQALFVALVTIVVLQNLEPTTLDVLFWSIPGLPKLVMLLAAMAAGGLVWEILRRRLFR
jgi:uncharacterized integral membrane protein